MKKTLCSVLALFLLILCGCSSQTKAPETSISIPQIVPETTTTAETTAASEEADASWSLLESLGQVAVENGVSYATISVPADLAGSDRSQEALDASIGELYTSAILQEDGSIIYKLTKAQHKAMIKDLEESFDAGLAELVADPGHGIARIDRNEDFTVFDAYLDTEEVSLTDGYTALLFCIYGNYYGLFKGSLPANVQTNFYNCDGTLMNTFNSSDAQ